MHIGTRLSHWLDYSWPERLFLRLVSLRTPMVDTVVFPGAHPNVLESEEWLADGVVQLNALLSRTTRARRFSALSIIIALRLIEGKWVDPRYRRDEAMDGFALAAYWLAAAGKRVMLLGPIADNALLNSGLVAMGHAPVKTLRDFDPKSLDALSASVLAITPETLRQYALYSECQPLDALPAVITPDYVLVSDGWGYFKQLLTLEAMTAPPAAEATEWMQFCFDTAQALPKTLAPFSSESPTDSIWITQDTKIHLSPYGQRYAMAFLEKSSRFRYQYTEPEFLLLVEEALKAQHVYRQGIHYEWTQTGVIPLPALKEHLSAAVFHFLALKDNQPTSAHQDILAAVALADIFGEDCLISGFLPYASQCSDGITSHLPIVGSTAGRSPPLRLDCRLVKHADAAAGIRSARHKDAAGHTLSHDVDFGTLASFAFQHQTPGVTLTIPLGSSLFQKLQQYSEAPLQATSSPQQVKRNLIRHLTTVEAKTWLDLNMRLAWHQEIRRPLRLIAAWRQTWLEAYQQCQKGQQPVTQFDLKAIILEFSLYLDESMQQVPAKQGSTDFPTEIAMMPHFQRVMTDQLADAEIACMTRTLAATAVHLLDQLRADLLSQACQLIHASALHCYAQQRPLHEFTRNIHAFMRASTHQFKAQLLVALDPTTIALSVMKESPV